MQFWFYKRIIIFFLFLISATTPAQTLVSHLTGWYPTTEPALAQKINTLDAQAKKLYAAPTDAHIRALIVPHAGYEYSGAVAAAAYRTLARTAYDTVIILTPSHTAPFSGIALSSATQYRVPNGTLDINTTIIKKLSQNTLFSFNDQLFNTEHAVEIQLPLICHYLKHVSIVPLIVGNVSFDELKKAAQTLKPLITEKTLVVASSDFTHYGARFGYAPFTDHQPLRIKQHDNRALQLIQDLDPHAFETFIKTTGSTICGYQPITLLLELIKNLEPRIIAYAQSNSAVTNDTESVSYATVAFTTQSLKTLPDQDQLNTFEQTELLKTAYYALDNLFTKKLSDKLYAPISTPALRSTHGAFVTLKTSTGALRGCIGNIIGIKPLVPTIIDLVASAALHDTRFTPVTEPESKTLTIELSILTQPRRIKNTSEIKLGTHGIILHVNGASAVYLPEVAPEQGWNLPTTLASLSEKAGLPANAWRNKNAWFEVFESIKIQSIKINEL